MKKDFISSLLNVSLMSALTLTGCSKIDQSNPIIRISEVIIAVPLMIVGLPLVYGAMVIQGEINYHKYYSNQDHMIGKEYELTQDVYLFHDISKNKFWLDKKYVLNNNQVDVVPSGTRLTVTYVYVYRANVEIGSHDHEVLAKFSLQGQEIYANISKLFDRSYVYSKSEENFIANPSVMIEIVKCSES